MTLVQMKYFSAVCACLNFTKAAKQLNVTQPAISAGIRELEQECGVTLFNRQKNNLLPTEEAQMLLQSVMPLLQQYEQLEKVVRALPMKRESLRVGFSTLGGNSVCSELLQQYRRNYPDVQVITVEDFNDKLFRRMEDNQLDLALLGLPPELSSTDIMNTYHALPVSEMRMRFCVNVDHPLSWKEWVTWEDIAHTPLVLLSGRFGQGRQIEGCLQQRGLKAQVVHYTDQAYTVERFIESNTAAGFLPLDVATCNRFMVGIPYGDNERRGPLCLYWRKDHQTFHARKAVIELARRCAPVPQD